MISGAHRFAGLAVIAGLACPTAYPCLAAAGNRAAQLAASCASCHRPDGRDTGIPSVSGLDENSIVLSLRAYRSNQRPGQIMHVVAAALSPEEIAAVAHYLAGHGAAPRQ